MFVNHWKLESGNHFDVIKSEEKTVYVHHQENKLKTKINYVFEDDNSIHLLVDKDLYEASIISKEEKKYALNTLYLNTTKWRLVMLLFSAIPALITILAVPYFGGVLLANFIHTEILFTLQYLLMLPFILLSTFYGIYIYKNLRYYNFTRMIYNLASSKEVIDRINNHLNHTKWYNKFFGVIKKDTTAFKRIGLPQLLIFGGISLLLLLYIIVSFGSVDTSISDIPEAFRSVYGEVGEAHYEFESKEELDALIVRHSTEYMTGYNVDDEEWILYTLDEEVVPVDHSIVLGEDEDLVSYSLYETHLLIEVENTDEENTDSTRKHYVYNIETEETIYIDFIADNLVEIEDYDKYSLNKIVTYNDNVYLSGDYYDQGLIVSIEDGDITYTLFEEYEYLSSMIASDKGLYYSVYKCSSSKDVYYYDFETQEETLMFEDVQLNSFKRFEDTNYAVIGSDRVGYELMALTETQSELQATVRRVNYSSTFENGFVAGFSNQSLHVYDSEFNLISEGMKCSECGDEFFFSGQVKKDTLILYGENHRVTLKYTEEAYYHPFMMLYSIEHNQVLYFNLIVIYVGLYGSFSIYVLNIYMRKKYNKRNFI